MLDVFFTVDVEIWCDGWSDIDRKFSRAYRQYITGSTEKGDYGLAYQVRILNDHGLRAVFFVEPLFSTRFGIEPLCEIIGIIQQGEQEVQLHLHPEWVDVAKVPLFADSARKRPYLFQYSANEQSRLIDVGISLLSAGGVSSINAFRAGSFGFNVDTLRALAHHGIAIDSSYNATMFGLSSGLCPGRVLVEPIKYEQIIEFPMTVFKDGMGKLRHVQLTACSYGEIERLLWQALEDRREAFIILSHNFELLSPSKTRPDDVVISRFKRLCQFLDRNRSYFRVAGFRKLTSRDVRVQPEPLSVPLWVSAKRMAEQIYRRKYR